MNPLRLAQLLSGWQIPPPSSLEAEIRADPSLADAAKKILPAERAVICHVASSQPKKEWPLAHWAKLLSPGRRMPDFRSSSPPRSANANRC